MAPGRLRWPSWHDSSVRKPRLPCKSMRRPSPTPLNLELLHLSFARLQTDYFSPVYPFSFHSASAGSAPDDVDWGSPRIYEREMREGKRSFQARDNRRVVQALAGTKYYQRRFLFSRIFHATTNICSLELFSRLENNYYLFSFFLSFSSVLKKDFSERFESFCENFSCDKLFTYFCNRIIFHMVYSFFLCVLLLRLLLLGFDVLYIKEYMYKIVNLFIFFYSF